MNPTQATVEDHIASPEGGVGALLTASGQSVVSTNLLGGCQGTTGPASTGPDGRAFGSRFGPNTVRDQVELERRVADRLVRRFASVLGGSMGGMRALEWAVTSPARVATALVPIGGAGCRPPIRAALVSHRLRARAAIQPPAATG